MGRKTITVPAAGETKPVYMTGNSIVIVSAPSYESIAAAPTISFENPGYDLPVIARSTYQFPPGCFERLVVTGTSESAGDEIIILATQACLPDFINTNALETTKAIAGNSFKKTMDGTVQELTELELIDAEGNLPASIYIAAHGGNINYLFNDGSGTDPSEAGTDYVLVDEAEPIEILGIDFALKLKFINSVAAETPDLIVTPRYQ